MIRVTRWSPDTCGCELEYEWDDAQDENTRTHRFKRAVHLCECHRDSVATEAYDEVLKENTRKNIVFAEAQKINPTLTVDDYAWSFDANRNLKVSLSKLTADQKKSLKSLCDDKFGSGKVEVA